jgi:two-component system CheB/CheR fusion protein
MGEFQKERTLATVHPLKTGAALKRRVLVVEDNLDSVHSMAVLVKMMGHEVEFAINGFAALEVARKFRPDIVLLDIGLPDFDGCKIRSTAKVGTGFREYALHRDIRLARAAIQGSRARRRMLRVLSEAD